MVQVADYVKVLEKKVEELKSAAEPVEKAFALARRAKMNADKQLSKASRAKELFETTPRRAPQRGQRGSKTRMKVADEALRLDMEEMAASEAASAAEEEYTQAKRAADARGWEVQL